jgi:hypothetical protein
LLAAEAAGLALEPAEPVPAAPIELLPLELGEVDEVSLDAVPELEPVVPPLLLPMLPVELGEVLAVPEPGVPPAEPVVPPPPPPRLQADSERAPTTDRMAAVAWIMVIFIGKLLV